MDNCLRSIQSAIKYISYFCLILMGLQIGTLKLLYANPVGNPKEPRFPPQQEALRKEYFLKRMNEGKGLLSPEDQERCERLGLYPASCFHYMEKRKLELMVTHKFPRQVLALTELYRKKQLTVNLQDDALFVKIAFANDYLLCPRSEAQETTQLCLPEAIFRKKAEAIFKDIPASELTEEIRQAMTRVAQYGLQLPLGK